MVLFLKGIIFNYTILLLPSKQSFFFVVFSNKILIFSLLEEDS